MPDHRVNYELETLLERIAENRADRKRGDSTDDGPPPKPGLALAAYTPAERAFERSTYGE